VFRKLLKLPGVHGNLIPDAHLAALAIEHGLTLCSSDGDFARFSSLRGLNPIGQFAAAASSAQRVHSDEEPATRARRARWQTMR
jgi:hypothetical protein